MITKLGGLSLTVWTDDVAGLVAFYQRLGFRNRGGPRGSADLTRDGASVVVLPATEARPHGTAEFALPVGLAAALREGFAGAWAAAAEGYGLMVDLPVPATEA